MKNFILSNEQKENIAKYKYEINDNSLTGKYLKNFWHWAETLFPSYVAPNIISIIGFIIVLYVWQLCYLYYDTYPFLTGIITVTGIFIYINLDSIDGIHARKLNNASALGELIDHGGDSISCIFITLTMCKILGVTNMYSIWYLTGFTTLIFHNAHLNAFNTLKVSFETFTGPSEMLIYACISLILKLYNFWIVDTISSIFDKYSILLFCTALIINIIYCIFYIKNTSPNTSIICLTVYGLYIIKAYLLHNISFYNIISDYIVLSIMTIDLMVSKMAKKSANYLIIFLVLISQIDIFFTILISIMIFGQYLYEISSYLDLPFLTTKYQ